MAGSEKSFFSIRTFLQQKLLLLRIYS